MSDHIAKLESRFLVLEAIFDPVTESMRFAILVSSMSNRPVPGAVGASVDTIKENKPR